MTTHITDLVEALLIPLTHIHDHSLYCLGRGTIDTSNTHIHDHSHYWLGRGTIDTSNTHVYDPSLSILLIHMYMTLTFYTPNTHVYDPHFLYS